MLDWIDRLFGNAPLVPVLLWVIAAGAAIWFLVRLVRKLWAPLKKFITLVDALDELPGFMKKTTTTLAAQDDKIAEIHHEVNYNNGSSVKDAVHRVELKVDGAVDELGTIREDQKKNSAAAGRAVDAATQAVTEAQNAAQLAKEALEQSSKGNTP